MRACFYVLLGCICACRFGGAESAYGVGNHEMSFAQVEILLEGEDGSRFATVPFLVAGEGRLPERYGPERERYQRVSVGDKVRIPFEVADGVVVFIEGGGMVSYYEADAIGTPFELELVAGAGTQIRLGKGWWLAFAGRVRRPMGNGDRHDDPEHAPHGVQGEVVLGVKKDF